MQGSGNFPDGQMPIGYGGLQTLINNLRNAISAANNGTVNSTAAMHEQERMLVTAFNLVKAHVDFVANSSPTPETIITSAGLSVSGTNGPGGITDLTLESNGNGKVTVRVPRSTAEKAFVYEQSTDGETFTKVIISSLSKISITGHTPGSTLYVRYCPVTKDGESAMSQAKSIIVI
jgi:hypothetical protein